MGDSRLGEGLLLEAGRRNRDEVVLDAFAFMLAAILARPPLVAPISERQRPGGAYTVNLAQVPELALPAGDASVET